MKQIEIENVTKVIKYEAIDGTVFSTKEECTRYEESAKCVLFSRYKSLVVKETTEEALYKAGSDEYNIDVVRINEEKDIDTVMQLYYYYNNYKSAIEQGEKIKEACLKALLEKDYLIIYRGYYDEDNFWIRGTVGELITHIKESCYATN